MPSESDYRRDFRLGLAARDTPPILLWTGILIVILSSISYLMDRADGFQTHAADIGVALAFIVAGLTLPGLSLPSRQVPRIFALLVTLLILALLYEIWLLPTALAMAYVMVVMCAFGPSTLSWPPFLTASCLTLVASAFVTATWAGDKWLDWTFAAIGATLIGTLLLQARVRSINALADATATIERLATTDELTGLLNRHGLATQLESMAANAQRLEQLLFVAFVDIDGLKRANDVHGHDFGDDVIRAVSTAVTETVRQGDLVARWGGDELIVVGMGAVPDDQAFSSRLHANIMSSGIDLAKWPGNVSIGLADGRAGVVEVDELITSADADMYQRRSSR
jgi:diguanylate cyclase (GGDEF)-like protein